MLKLLKKRLFSSPAAFRDTLAQHRRSLAEATRPERSASPARPRGGILQRMIEEVEEEYADDDALRGGHARAPWRSTTSLFREPLARRNSAAGRAWRRGPSRRDCAPTARRRN